MKTFELIIHPLTLGIDLLGKFCGYYGTYWYYFLVGKLFCINIKGWTNRSDPFSRLYCVPIVHSCLGSKYQYLGLELITTILFHHIQTYYHYVPSWWNIKSNLRSTDPPAKTGIYSTLVFHVAILDKAYHLIFCLFASVSFSSYSFSIMFTATLTIFSHS